MAYFWISGFALNISSMIMLFTITAALLHRTPIRFIRAFTGAAKVSGPVAAVPALRRIGRTAGLCGGRRGKPLQTLLAQAVVSGATEYTLPFLTFVGSLIISLFVPSGGGHWAVQGRSRSTGAGRRSAFTGLPRADLDGGGRRRGRGEHDPAVLLPLLAIAKLNVRQVMGFTIVAFFIGFVVLGAMTLIAPHVI